MSFYQSIASYYDYIFPPSQAQGNFVEEKLEGLSGKMILEAGCGTGNLARILAEKDARVEGIDLDAEMIRKALRRSSEVLDIRFRELDILDIDNVWPPETFDGIVSFGNTLVHLSDDLEVADFFKKARKLLKPGGKLMVQIINYDRILDQDIRGLSAIDNEHVRFERYYDPVEDMEHIDFRTVLTVKTSGKIIRNLVRLYPIREKQIENLLKESGYQNIEFWGNFGGDPLNASSVPLVFAAQA
ncbi:MAG: class I SAM-dependent methyltransferase [Marinilabilia sp.]